MDRVQDLLRRLALNDEGSVAPALDAATTATRPGDLDPKTHALVRLGALVSVGAPTASYRCTVERAYAAGATDEEIVGVLGAVAPAVGFPRLVAAAPDLALAIGYDVETDLDLGPVDAGPAPPADLQSLAQGAGGRARRRREPR